MSYFDEWYDHGGRGRQSEARVRYVERREGMLSPSWDQGAAYGQALQRTRSVGHAPAPTVQIINRNDDHSRSPPRGRGHSRDRYRAEEDIANEIAGLRADLHRDRSRSRSAFRSPSPGYGYAPPPPPGGSGYQNWQLEHIYRDGQDRINYEREANRTRMEIAMLEERIKREDEEAKMKSYTEQVEWKAERERLRAEAKAKADREDEDDRIRKALRDREDRDRKAKEERDRAVKDYEMKAAEEEKERKDAARRAVEAYERKKREEKEEKERLKMQFKLEEEQEKKEELERQKAWELAQAKKAEMLKAAKKAEEDKLEAEMHRRLGKFGFQDNQIEAMLHADEKKNNNNAGALVPVVSSSSSSALVFKQPKYFKVHKDYLSIETLRYYKIPYDDRSEKDYIIILREMDQDMTDVLFEHTKRHRSSQLFIEDRGRKNDPQYAWVRKKSKSRSRSRIAVSAPVLFESAQV